MRRTSVDSILSSIEHSPDQKSNFSSNPTLETIKVQEEGTSTSTLNHSQRHKRYLKLWSHQSKEEEEVHEINKKRNKICKSIANLTLTSFGKSWKRPRFIKSKFSKFHSTNELFVTAPPSPRHSQETPTPITTVNVTNVYPIIPEIPTPTDLDSPRLSYDSAYTTIEYTDSIRNSAGSELSFRCRGLVYSKDEDELWDGCVHGVKDLENCLFCRVDDWVRIDNEDLSIPCDLSNS